MREAAANGRFPPLGKVLRRERLISRRQLKQALRRQAEEPLRLGQLVVQMGLAREGAILQAIHKHYQLELRSLSEDLAGKLRLRAMMLGGRRRGPRLSIKAKLSITVIFMVCVSVVGLGYVALSRQRENLYRQTVRTGKVSLNYIASSARVPLLEGNVLQLNGLVREAATVEGVVYAIIADRNNVVQAHTDPTKIRKKRVPPPNRSAVTREGSYTYYDYYTLGGTHVLNISTPVSFQSKVLGQADVGISLDFIQQQINRETITVVLLGLPILLLGFVVAIFMGIGFSRPIHALVEATRQIGRGNLKYQIRRIRNDELGDLARAFNYMAAELWKKQIVQESFGKYVGTEVVELILADPENAWLKGSRSQATVLFTDIRNFTAYAERRAPERVVAALNEYFDIVTRNIREHGGYVDKFIGDAVMAVFGVPLPDEQHAERAVRAALAMQRELTQAARGGNEVLGRIGIGLNAGSVVSGNIGSQDKMEYTVIGDSVNVASRINAFAGPGEVVISESIYRTLRTRLSVEPLPPQRVKGKTHPIQTYKVLGFVERASQKREGRRGKQEAV